MTRLATIKARTGLKPLLIFFRGDLGLPAWVLGTKWVLARLLGAGWEVTIVVLKVQIWMGAWIEHGVYELAEHLHDLLNPQDHRNHREAPD